MTLISPQIISLRNGIYQGYIEDYYPQGLGLFMDDNLVLHCSEWKRGQYNGPTAILVSHSKYMYGGWENGVPNGFNIFRDGDAVLLGNFVQGRTDKQLAIIFQKQKLVVIGYPSQQKFTIESKKQYQSEQELKAIIMNSLLKFQQKYFSLVRYLNANFCGQNSILTLDMKQQIFRFGYLNGLVAMFDDQNYIQKLGQIDQNNQLFGLGAHFSNIVQMGNFNSKNVLRYEQKMRQVSDIRKLLRNQFKKSLQFKNDYLITKQLEVIHTLQIIMQMAIQNILQSCAQPSKNIIKKQLQDSLQAKINPLGEFTQNQRLKMIRQQLKKSIGLPCGVKPSPKQLKYINYPQYQSRQYNYGLNKSNENQQNYTSTQFNKNNWNTFLKKNRLADIKTRQIRLPLDNLYHNQHLVPQSIQQNVERQSFRSKNDTKNILSSNRRRQSFSPSPIYSNKGTNKNSPNKSIKQFNGSIANQTNPHQLIDSFNPKDYHTNRRVQQLIDQIVNSRSRKTQSPYKRHALQSIQDSNARVNLPPGYSRGYIPVSHEKKISQSPSPKKKENDKSIEKQKNTVKKGALQPPVKVPPFDRTARSYLQIFRTGNTPNKQAVNQIFKSKGSRSPTPTNKKNPKKQNKQPPLSPSQPKNDLFFLKKDDNIENLKQKNRMIEQITLKYNRAKNH